MSKEAQRIMAKYPGHVPVICARPEAPNDKKKFLIPVSMGGKDFANTVCEKCPWASASATISAGGNVLSGTLGLTAAELHEKYKAQDGFLYVHVSQAPAADAGAAAEQTSASADKPAEPKEPMVFHMPDCDQETESVSMEAKRVRKVINKHPDHLPVLVRQAPTAGLPNIDKKLLVPRSMTCANLQGVLPKHLGLPMKDGQAEKWKGLQIFMGDIPIPPEFVMSSVYDQYVDEDDGGLHLTLRLEGHTEEKGHQLELNSVDTVALQVAELIEANEAKDALLLEAREKMVCALAEAEGRAADAESQMQKMAGALQDKSEELLVTRESSLLESSVRQAALDDALAKVTELTNQLKKSEEARKAAEEACLEAQTSVDRISGLLTAEKAEKERAQAREKQLAEKLAALEAAAQQGCTSWPANKTSSSNECEADGFVDLGWDGDGFNGGLGDEFEVVTGPGR